MGDLLQTGSAWLSGQMKAHGSTTVTYRRGSDSVTWTVVIGRTEHEVADGFERTKVESHDFIGDADELILGSDTVTPNRGDRIELTVGAETWHYEVMAPGPRMPHWKYGDPYHERIRVHTKRVKVA